MSRKLLNSIVIPGVLLLVGACAQQTPKNDSAPASEPAPEPAMTETAPAATTPMELTAEKVTEIAQVVVNIAKNPGSAENVLAEHGMTQAQLDDAVARIQADPALQSMFDQAKTAAEGAMGAASGAADAAKDAMGGTTEGH
jgi:hypothetical protein